jgi:hypothetical protein
VFFSGKFSFQERLLKYSLIISMSLTIPSPKNGGWVATVYPALSLQFLGNTCKKNNLSVFLSSTPTSYGTLLTMIVGVLFTFACTSFADVDTGTSGLRDKA